MTNNNQEEVKRLLREELSNNLLKEHSDIAAAFREGLERATTAHIFPNDPAQYFVAQVVDVKFPILISNQSGFTHTLFNGYHASPVSAKTLLIPFSEDQNDKDGRYKDERYIVTIDKTEDDDESILLKIPLSEEWYEKVEKEGFYPEKLELDLYCDTQNDRAKQKAFLELLQGRWPDKLALPELTRDYWPKVGVRPPIESDSRDEDSQISHLINFLKHPFESRFFRLPLSLLNNDEFNKNGIKVSVKNREVANDIEKHLKGLIKTNCVLFWNRAIGLSDRQDYLERLYDSQDQNSETPIRISIDFGSRLYDGGIVAVLDCIDRASGERFYDRRWAFGVEQNKCFSVGKDDSNYRSFYLDFFNSKKQPSPFYSQLEAPDLFLRFIMSEQWKGLHKSLKNSSKSFKEVLSIGDLPTFSMIEPPVSDNLAGWGERERTIGLLWLANGVGDFPFPQRAVVTRTQLAKLLLQLMPKLLADATKDKDALKINDFEFSQVIKPRPAPWGNEDKGKKFAFVITEVIIKKNFDIDKEKIDYYLKWLSRAAAPFCPAGTCLDIKANIQVQEQSPTKQEEPSIKNEELASKETTSSRIKLYKKVAVDVEASAGNQTHPADTERTGKWKFYKEMLKKETTPLLKTEKGTEIHAIYFAIAMFSYEGGSIKHNDKVINLPPLIANLELKGVVLNAETSVLVEGNKVTDSYGNKLEVSKTSDQVEIQVEIKAIQVEKKAIQVENS